VQLPRRAAETMPAQPTAGIDAKKKMERINVRDAIRNKTETSVERTQRLKSMRLTLERKMKGHTVRCDMLKLQNTRHEIEIEKMLETPDV
tara:strand:+ start:2821 stop:3090 length:270 start_codon:yes stop_codon:yes gene_type:complete